MKSHHAFLTVDLGFGDAGKGSVVDYLTRTYDAHTVLRFNGGAQAGHRVVTGGSNPQEHVFAQFGSGTLAGAATYLARFMLLDPLAMVVEAKHLQHLGVVEPFARTTIDAGALVITPFTRAVNRLKELARGADRHGSCGMGIGETMADALDYGEWVVVAGDLAQRDRLYQKLAFVRQLNIAKIAPLRATLPATRQAAEELDMLTDPDWADWLLAAYADFAKNTQIVGADYLHTLLQRPGNVVFEAAQGVLLDEWYGFHPHTTWSTTTLAQAERLLAEGGYTGNTTRLGLTRAYTPRHGAGPLVTEDSDLTQELPDARNGLHAWQQGFRVGWLDLVLLRYACEVVGRLDGLVVTCLDRIETLPELQFCSRYRYDTLIVERIAPTPTPHDLAYQERITNALLQCRPRYERVTDSAELLQRIEATLNTPILLVSRGPTAEEKESRG